MSTTINDTNDRPSPVFKNGDWVAVRNGTHPEIGIVKEAYESLGEPVLDIVLYDRTGLKVGRNSPALDGPKTYEPACTAANWARIARPKFPLSRYGYDHELVWIDER
jgi:hypothetical protein